MPEKLKSRKFWQSVAGEVAGMVTLIYGVTAGELVATIAGAAITVLVILGYLKVEGEIDKVREGKWTAGQSE